MALGLLATVITGIKMTTFHSFGTGDSTRDTFYSSLYAELELLIGIIAACLPTLKAPVERLLRRKGFLSEPAQASPSDLSFVNVSPKGGEEVSDVEKMSERKPSK